MQINANLQMGLSATCKYTNALLENNTNMHEHSCDSKNRFILTQHLLSCCHCKYQWFHSKQSAGRSWLPVVWRWCSPLQYCWARFLPSVNKAVKSAERTHTCQNKLILINLNRCYLLYYCNVKPVLLSLSCNL